MQHTNSFGTWCRLFAAGLFGLLVTDVKAAIPATRAANNIDLAMVKVSSGRGFAPWSSQMWNDAYEYAHATVDEYTVNITDDDDKFLATMFHCKNAEETKSPLALSQTLFIMVLCFLPLGTLSAIYEWWHRPPKAEFPEKTEEPKEMSPFMQYLMLVCSIFGGCAAYAGNLVSELLVIVGFAYCGYWSYMVIYILITAAANIFAAVEYAYEATGVKEKMYFFMLSILQVRMYRDARQSWNELRVTPGLARQKFLDAMFQSGPQAVFAVYVLYYLGLQFNFWLVLSTLASVLSLASGMSVWFDFTFSEQLKEQGISAATYGVQWYHHVLWISFFSTDFALRLLTLGLFLSVERLRPASHIIVICLLILYYMACLIPIAMFQEEQEEQGFRTEVWQITTKEFHVANKVIAQRPIDALMFTFLVHALPADLRLAPHNSKESRLFYAMHPKVRARIMRIVIPLRIVDFLVLGSITMLTAYDRDQCIALVGMFVVMHILLYQVRQIEGPPIAIDADNEIPKEVMKRVSELSEEDADRERGENERLIS